MGIPLVAFVPVLIGLVAVGGVFLKVFHDRDMPLMNGVTVAVLAVVWAWLSVRNVVHFDRGVQDATWVIAAAILVLIGGQIKRKIDRDVPRHIAEQRRARRS